MQSPFPSKSLPWRTALGPISFLPFLPDYLCIFLTALVVQGVLLPGSSECSLRIAPHVDVFLVHLWREVSSMSSYSTILF